MINADHLHALCCGGGNLLIQEVDQYELGLKWVTQSLSVYGTLFHTEVDPTFFIALTGAGPADIVTQEAEGIELDALWNSGTGFYVTLNATIQDTEIKKGPNAGNETQRQPGWQLRVTPSYSFLMGNSFTTIYGTFSAVDDRWGEPANVNRLAGYEKIDLGAIVSLNGGFSIQLSGDNLTDEDALTESDPRDIAAPNGRYIMPRSIRLGVGYKF